MQISYNIYKIAKFIIIKRSIFKMFYKKKEKIKQIKRTYKSMK